MEGKKRNSPQHWRGGFRTTNTFTVPSKMKKVKIKKECVLNVHIYENVSLLKCNGHNEKKLSGLCNWTG